eukprot:jgi/Botrbrau1/21517/Bobra.174_2s0020.1
MGQPAALDEDAILKYRITTGIAATRGEAPIKRVVKCWQTYANDLRHGTLKDAENSSRALAIAFSALQAQVRKLEAACHACIREQEYYDNLKLQFQEAIKTAEQDIARLKIDLEEARQVRMNNEQYEAVREKIMQFPSRATTLQEIERVNEQRTAAENEFIRLKKAVEWRKRQFALLCNQLDELTNLLDGDEMPMMLDLPETKLL